MKVKVFDFPAWSPMEARMHGELEKWLSEAKPQIILHITQSLGECLMPDGGTTNPMGMSVKRLILTIFFQ